MLIRTFFIWFDESVVIEKSHLCRQTTYAVKMFWKDSRSRIFRNQLPTTFRIPKVRMESKKSTKTSKSPWVLPPESGPANFGNQHPITFRIPKVQMEPKKSMKTPKSSWFLVHLTWEMFLLQKISEKWQFCYMSTLFWRVTPPDDELEENFLRQLCSLSKIL